MLVNHTKARILLPSAMIASTLLTLAIGCASEDQGPSDSGTGGSGVPTGGSVGTQSGGSIGTASGGAEGSATGGSSMGSGGASGGVASGGSESSQTGGAGGSSSGGSDNSGGSASGGSASTGGSSGTAMSAGCGQAASADGPATIEVGSLTREYILALPEGYDPDMAYRLIFTWHPWGGSAQQVAGNGPGGYYGLLGASEGEAILVSPEGLDFGGNGLGWGNEDGQDIEFMRAMLARFDSELCFDHDRVFSTGFSFGGMMSNAVACAGLARAVAPMAGNSSVSGCENGTTPVAYMGFHGDADSVVAIGGGETARDVFVERNGCGAAMPSESDWCDLAGGNYQPCECTSYEGCTDGYPVTWCQFSGSHMVAPNSGQTIWDFFAQF